MLEETQDTEELIERVAALDIGKKELVCCVRVHDRIWFHPTRCSPSAQRRCQRRPCRLARTTPT